MVAADQPDRPHRQDRRDRARAVRRRGTAPAPARGRVHPRRAGDDPASDGRGCAGGRRQHGRRHPARRARRPLSRAASLLPPAVQPGDQPADRQPARGAGHDAQDTARQSRQRARRGFEPVRPAAARKPGAVECRVHRHAGVHGQLGLRHRLHVPGRRPRGRAAGGDRSHSARGGGGRARRLHPHHPDRREPGRQTRADPDDPRRRRRAYASRAAIVADVHQPQRALGRVYGCALLCRSHRRRRHHDQRLSGAGIDRRPSSARPVRRDVAEIGRAALQEGGRQGAAEGDVQDGHLRHLLLSGRLQLRGDRSVSFARRRILPRHAVAYLRHRAVRHRAESARLALDRLGCRRRDPAGRRSLQDAAARRGARVRCLADPHAANGRRNGQLYALQAIRRRRAEAATGRRPRSARFPRRRTQAGGDRRGREHHRDPQAAALARHFARSAEPRGARDAVDRDEPHRRPVRQWRGRRRPGPAEAARQRRQRVIGDQADRVGPLRRHRRIPERLPRDRDQGRAGRQARRGGPAARHQGLRPDRQAAAFHPRHHADQPAAASRHLLDRGSRAAHLRPEADQSGSRGLRQAGGAQRYRNDRGGRRQGAGRCNPDLRPFRRHRARARKAASSMPAAHGRWACRRLIRC